MSFLKEIQKNFWDYIASRCRNNAYRKNSFFWWCYSRRAGERIIKLKRYYSDFMEIERQRGISVSNLFWH
jgi:hypothetical protein